MTECHNAIQVNQHNTDQVIILQQVRLFILKVASGWAQSRSVDQPNCLAKSPLVFILKVDFVHKITNLHYIAFHEPKTNLFLRCTVIVILYIYPLHYVKNPKMCSRRPRKFSLKLLILPSTCDKNLYFYLFAYNNHKSCTQKIAILTPVFNIRFKV